MPCWAASFSNHGAPDEMTQALFADHHDYARGSLSRKAAGSDPFALFTRWLDQAEAAGLPQPNAMTLATADRNGQPSARIVLLKGFDAGGFVWFTNTQSRKGRELAQNAQAALLFFWPPLERCVRIEGPVQSVSAAESDAYFASRPLAARIGAWASPQSEPVDSRLALMARVAAAAAQHGTAPVRPPFWGGYRLAPVALEFWQGRASRLHDRIRFSRTQSGDPWRIERLAP